MKLISIDRSNHPDKKFNATFSDGSNILFGAKGYSDYTLHKDKDRRERYRARHAKDNLTDPKSPGALSWYILWGDSTSMQKNILQYKRRFNL